MTKSATQLCRHSMAVLMVLQATAIAQPVSLAQLRNHLLEHETTSGRFVQCTMHGSASIAGVGRFTFSPGKQIKLNFEQPHKYSVVFFSDGTQIKTINGIEQKVPHYSSVGRLMFSIMNMQKSLLDNRFKIELQGTIDQFNMSLIPRKRKAGIVQAVEIGGVAGLVNAIQVKTRNSRTISIRLFPEGQPVGIACG